ncbi:hypothetical protein B0I35DRAFT_408413 [Stachybotrys elegans]|uniref:Uncharacterized protein n=1 Tax=Stachybotrys elegans TaxID=80388 RepID=A0A8K0SVJ2_9HYPO|nr:hypothetical protein B0I35DRAFT_408413 [Stachybotrys elegans]
MFTKPSGISSSRDREMVKPMPSPLEPNITPIYLRSNTSLYPKSNTSLYLRLNTSLYLKLTVSHQKDRQMQPRIDVVVSAATMLEMYGDAEVTLDDIGSQTI